MSQIKRIPIEEATLKQLRDYAELSLGLSVADNASQDQMTAAILEVDSDRTIIITDEASGEMEPGQTNTGNRPSYMANIDQLPGAIRPMKGKGPAYKTDPLVVIVIAKEDKPGGHDDVSVGVNGSCMQIPRGRACEVPYRFFMVLVNAQKLVIEHDLSNPLEVKEIKKVVPSYPVEVKVSPPREEIMKWFAADRAKTDVAAAA